MSDWNAESYLKFKKERTQPCIDLAARVRSAAPKTVADLGCGPGNSTAVLKSLFPGAVITGFDNSENMIRSAKENCPDLQFELRSVWDLEQNYDLIFSNACLQWVPDHEKLIPFLFAKLNSGGLLAVQMPMNAEEPLFKIIKETAETSEFDFSSVYFEKNDILKPEAYYDLLSRHTDCFTIWETVYYHTMKDHSQLIDWVRSTRLRPYLSVLNEQEQQRFEQEILERAIKAYPLTENGSIIFRFRRLFFVAQK